MNSEQLKAFNLLTSKQNMFLTGGAGVGKSFTLEKYYDYATKRYGPRYVYKTASTGAAAVLIGGKTLHSWAGIMLGKGTVEELIQKMPFPIKKRWKRTKVLFIDEISMITPHLFDKLEEIARILRRTSLPFGGIQVVLSGDFFQLPPVKCDLFCFESRSWDRVVKNTYTLKTIVRQNDKKFQKLLNNIRYGELSVEDSDILHSKVDAPLINEFGIEPTILFPKNLEVNRLNNKKLKELLLTEPEFVFKSTYKVEYNNSSVPKDKIIQKFQKIEERTLDVITLAKGTQVVVKHNVDVELGIANGSRGIVTKFVSQIEGGPVFPMVQLLSGIEYLAIPVDFEYEIDNEYKIIKNQVPLKLAWATTVHSCQGSTLDYIKADIGENVFSCGQAYVALSRVKNLEGLTLIEYDPDSISAHPKVLEKYGPQTQSIDGPLDKLFSNLKTTDST
jgi:ATP-dependent DNA helicase PIF1